MRHTLIVGLLLVVSLWVLVMWLEPRMAFFPWTGIQETPAAKKIAYEDVRIETSDRVTLHGWWMPHPSPRAQVVYWHGNGGNLSLWLDVLADIQGHGISVLAVDYRGYGASSGKPSEKGIYRDADAVTDVFAQRFQAKGVPTIYWGRSLGCAVASYAASRRSPGGMILESPFADVRSLFAGNPIMSVLGLFSSYKFATARHLESFRGPLLVIHGDADTIIPYDNGRRVFERAATTNKTFVTLPGTDHNDHHGGHSAYWPAVEAFLRRFSSGS